MASYSVFEALSSHVAKYYIASEVLEPATGWDYNGLIPTVKFENNGTSRVTTPIEYGKYIVDYHVAQGEVETYSDIGSGYTLGLFDSDEFNAFKNEFDSLIRMMSIAISQYDYAMFISLFRGISSTTEILSSFALYDMEGFLYGLIDNNIYFNTCPKRMIQTGENVLKHWNNGVIYFNSDFVRRDLSGLAFFWNPISKSLLADYSEETNNLGSDNYLEFLELLRNNLVRLYTFDPFNYFSNNSCHVPIPIDDDVNNYDIIK